MALNPRQLKFKDEYLIDRNATQAAIRAGYSEKTAYSQGQRLLKHVEMRKALELAIEKQSARTELTADYVLKGFHEVAERCLERAPVLVRVGNRFEQLTDNDGNNVWQFNAPGANKALEMVGRHLGMFTDKIVIDMALDISGHVTLDTAFNSIENLTGRTKQPMKLVKKVG